MPRITKPSTTQRHEGNGRAVLPVPGGNRLADRIRSQLRQSQAEIGSARYEDSSADGTASWANLADTIDTITWLVPNWVAQAGLTGLIGQPKDGKSAFAKYGLVKPVVTGCCWFTGLPGPEPGFAIWVDTEHRAAVNIGRAKKWGLPLDRIKTPFLDDPLRPIDIENREHIDRLFNVVCRYKAPLVVVDSFRGAHKGDENNSRIVTALHNLAEIAENTKTAVVLIHHTKKLAVDEEINANSGRGSNAFLAMVGAQLAIDRPDPKNPWRRSQVLGENLGIAPRPVGFLVTDTGLQFGEAPTRPRKSTEKDAAEAWLRERMKPGVVYRASELLAEAEQNGHTVRTIRKAASERLGVRPKPVHRDGKIAEWEWRRSKGGDEPRG